jgi:DNA-binding NarL/FixJ family response regulator
MDPSMDSLRVVLVDDIVLFRQGVEALLTRAGVDVVGVAGSADEAKIRVAAERPAVVIMDIRMPPDYTDEGLRAALELKAAFPGLGVVLLSAYVQIATAMRLVDEHSHGIGYLLKERVASIETLVDDLRRVAKGGVVLDPEIVTKLFGQRKNAEVLDSLTQRERAVLAAMAEGKSNASIAGQLNVVTKTVEGNVSEVFRKLGLPASADENRRVLAVLTYLRARSK